MISCPRSSLWENPASSINNEFYFLTGNEVMQHSPRATRPDALGEVQGAPLTIVRFEVGRQPINVSAKPYGLKGRLVQMSDPDHYPSLPE